MNCNELRNLFSELGKSLKSNGIDVSFDGECLDISSSKGIKLAGCNECFYPMLDPNNYYEDEIKDLTAEDILDNLINIASDVDCSNADIHIETSLDEIDDDDLDLDELNDSLHEAYSDFYDEVASAIEEFKEMYLSKQESVKKSIHR